MKNALQIIIAKSPAAASEAMDCIRAIRAKSPVVQSRYERTVSLALSDPQADFTSAERELIAGYLSDEDEAGEMRQRNIRLSDADWQRATEIGDGSATAGIRRALAEWRE